MQVILGSHLKVVLGEIMVTEGCQYVVISCTTDKGTIKGEGWQPNRVYTSLVLPCEVYEETADCPEGTDRWNNSPKTSCGGEADSWCCCKGTMGA